MTRLGLDTRRGTARRRACAIGAAVRNSHLAEHPLVRTRYPVRRPGDAVRRVRPAAQHGHRGRQPAAAHPLPLLLRRVPRACNKRVAGHRLRRHRRVQPDARHARRQRTLHGHAPLGHVRRAGRAGRRGRGAAARAARGGSRSASSTGCPATPGPRDVAGAGRADHRGRAAGAAAGRDAPRYRKVRDRASLRVRAGLGGRARWTSRTARSATSGWRWAGSRTSRGGRTRPSGRCVGGPATDEAFRAAASAELAPAPAAPDNEFKIELARAHDRRRSLRQAA